MSFPRRIQILQLICRRFSSNPSRPTFMRIPCIHGITPSTTSNPLFTKLLSVRHGESVIQGQLSRRHLWGMLNAVFNRPDNNRIKEVGAHRACAEWLLRCGAHVKWEGFKNFQDDYNKLPVGGFNKFKIEEINADDAAIMAIGFPHFDGVNTVKKIRFHHCAYFEDDALSQLGRLKDSLEAVEISSCGDISDRGLETLAQLTKLKSLLLYDLPNVRHKEEALKKLQKALPNCTIDFKDVQRDKTA